MPDASISDYLGVQTNNVAEYTGVVRALELARELGAGEVHLLLDSKLIVEQLSGRWRVKDAKLIPLWAAARATLDGFLRWTADPRATGAEHGRRRACQRGDRSGGRGWRGVRRPATGAQRMSRAWAWIRSHWQIIVAPLLTIGVILGAMIWSGSSDPPVSGTMLTDNPAGFVEGEPYEPDIDPADFSTTITNPYMPLVPGTSLSYEGGGERVVVTVTGRTRQVMGVETVVVRDREWRGAALVEDTEDWFAQDGDGNVWYFGEDTAECRDGQVTSHAGAWEAGVDDAEPGIVMLGAPRVGDTYRQEYYAGQAEDAARVRELGATVDFGDGTTYEEVLVTEDFTALEPGVLEHKFYAPEVGLIEEQAVRGGGGVRLEAITVDDPGIAAAGPLCQG